MITRKDFTDIGNIAIHCDMNKLNIAIKEAIIFDLSELFYDFWNDIELINKEVELNQSIKDLELKLNLLNGGEYTDCKGKKRFHLGIKKILAYYSYARYLVLNGFNDTPNGNVSKTNDFSLPKPLKEVEMFADKYRSMGYVAFNRTKEFLCNNKKTFGYYCKDCNCKEVSSKSSKSKGYGIRSKILRKNL